MTAVIAALLHCTAGSGAGLRPWSAPVPALQIMMLNNGCMCCTVKEDLLKMLFELVSRLPGALCLYKGTPLPLLLRHVHLLLLALEVPPHVLGST